MHKYIYRFNKVNNISLDQYSEDATMTMVDRATITRDGRLKRDGRIDHRATHRIYSSFSLMRAYGKRMMYSRHGQIYNPVISPDMVMNMKSRSRLARPISKKGRNWI